MVGSECFPLEGAPIRRPPLPLELARHIVSFLGISVPDPAHTVATSNGVRVTAHSSDIEGQIWFSAGPWDLATIQSFTTLHLVTESKDQGWVGDRSVGLSVINLARRCSSSDWIETEPYLTFRRQEIGLGSILQLPPLLAQR